MSLVTSSPLMSPRPARSEAGRDPYGYAHGLVRVGVVLDLLVRPDSATMVWAAITLESTSTDPTDRSMPAVMITNVTPTASSKSPRRQRRC